MAAPVAVDFEQVVKLHPLCHPPEVVLRWPLPVSWTALCYKRQDTGGRRQEARGKRQEARGKRQEARGKSCSLWLEGQRHGAHLAAADTMGLLQCGGHVVLQPATGQGTHRVRSVAQAPSESEQGPAEQQQPFEAAATAAFEWAAAQEAGNSLTT